MARVLSRASGVSLLREMTHARPSVATARLVVAQAQPPASAAPSLLLPPSALRQAKLLYATAGAPRHNAPGHPECAARVPAILEALARQELSSRPDVVELTAFAPASRQAVLAVHDPRFVVGMEGLKGETLEYIDPAPTYATSSTCADAFLAAGAVLALVDHVVAASREQEQEELASASGTGSASSRSSSGGGGAAVGAPAAFAICRPPGHHSMPQHAMGFCIYGNVAIAARYAQQRHGLRRVLIFDFDVHHGNGTEAVFWEDPNVLFISTHQEYAYPNTGKLQAVGKGEGEGATINIPLPGGSGQEAELAAMEEVVAPAARRFRPDIILVSAGYDGHWLDPLAGLQFRSATYHALGRQLKALADELCGGRIVFLLEGPEDKLNPDLLREEPLEKVQKVLAEVQRLHGL
eukprot:scaffold6.g2887.t1